MSGVHDAAARGYDRAAAAYARARPGYPPEAVEWLAGRVCDPARAVVEIGAGTGKFTRELVARGYRVVAVEPVPAMRAKLPESVEAVDATAERLPFAAGSVGALIASQSLHWTDVDRALAEFARVLAPDAAIGLIWNFRDLAVPWQLELDALLADLRGDAPHSRDGRWQRAVERSAFAVADTRTWRWAVETDVCERVRSASYVAALPEEERTDVDARVRAILRRHGFATDVTNFPYVTEAYVLRRR
jgi:SAM-dependent methyltransferase